MLNLGLFIIYNLFFFLSIGVCMYVGNTILSVNTKVSSKYTQKKEIQKYMHIFTLQKICNQNKLLNNISHGQRHIRTTRTAWPLSDTSTAASFEKVSCSEPGYLMVSTSTILGKDNYTRTLIFNLKNRLNIRIQK